MVYCGKPSKSCEACRKTKTKCDRIHPACGQCIRTGRVCPGYRDLDSFIFRDETTRILQKARRTPPHKGVIPKGDSWDQKVPHKVQTISLHSLVPDRRGQALCLFFSEYATDIQGVYDYVPAVCSSASTPSSAGCLHDTIELIGLGHLYSMRYGASYASETELDVYKKHTSVLGTINEALQDPFSATMDETLVVVMLLGLFETVTCMKPMSLRVWTNHILGAVALIEARGLAQFETETGRRIFQHLLDYIQLSALQRRQPIPQDIIDIALLPCAAQTPHEKTHQELFRITAILAQVRYKAACQSEWPETILALAKAVDASLEQWAASMPPEYCFLTVPAVPGQNTLDGVYHHYPDRHIARLWNGYRMSSIINATTLARQAELINTPGALDDLVAALDRQREMSAGLCDSVPYYELQGPMTAIVGHAVLWPLYCVATASNVTARSRLWVVQRMHDISTRTATMQGVQIANALARQLEVTVWEREGDIDEGSKEW